MLGYSGLVTHADVPRKDRPPHEFSGVPVACGAIEDLPEGDLGGPANLGMLCTSLLIRLSSLRSTALKEEQLFSLLDVALVLSLTLLMSEKVPPVKGCGDKSNFTFVLAPFCCNLFFYWAASFCLQGSE